MLAMLHCALLASYLGLALFLFGFFLTRRELSLKAKSNVPSLYETATRGRTSAPTLLDLSNADGSSTESHTSTAQHCQSRKKVFFFIVDALRLDFMSWHEGHVPADSPYNRMTNMHDLLRHNASQCTLFGFRADPPTVTSQRLKSLTTGTLPTFIDIGANMNSSAITDDNFIDQLLHRQHSCPDTCSTDIAGTNTANTNNTQSCSTQSNLVVLGDDTWCALFPTQFTTSHLYDSFNTRDLDTVDNGIISHLFDYLKPREHMDPSANTSGINSTHSNADWDLMIAHFLGVDHIGHTHHAFHPHMNDRVALMDKLLLRVIQSLPQNSVLLLFGDHGMTDEGEHGGASRQEIDSGLFVYATEPMFTLSPPISVRGSTDANSHSTANEATPQLLQQSSQSTHTTVDDDNHTMPYWHDRSGFIDTTVHSIRTHPRIIPQTDLTPTVSVLLGLPIPASSLGMVIPELFLHSNMHSNLRMCKRESHMHGNSSSSCVEDHLMETFYVNAMQIWKYLTTYWQGTNTISAPIVLSSAEGDLCAWYCSLHTSAHAHSELVQLEDILLYAVRSHLLYLVYTSQSNGNNGACSCPGMVHAGVVTKQQVYVNYVTFFRAVQDFTRNKWTQFKIPHMVAALCIMLSALVVLLIEVAAATSVGVSAARTACSVNDTCSLLALHALATVCTIVRTAADHLTGAAYPATLLMVPLGAAFHSLAAFSNSFTEQEHWIVFSLVQASGVVIGAQMLCSRMSSSFPEANISSSTEDPDNKSVAHINNRSEKSIPMSTVRSSTLYTLASGLIASKLVWQYGPHSIFTDKVLVGAATLQFLPAGAQDMANVACVTAAVVLLHTLLYRHLSAVNIASTVQCSSSTHAMSVLYKCVHALASLCMLLYWAVKHNAAYSNNMHSCTKYMCAVVPIVCTVDWLIVLPSIVLTLCAGSCISIVVSPYMHRRAESVITDGTARDAGTARDSVLTYRRQYTVMYYLMVHLTATVALVVGLLLGPAGCVLMVFCLVHSVLFVRTFCTMIHVTGTSLWYAIGPAKEFSCSVDSGGQSSTTAGTTGLLLQLCFALYFPMMGRFLYFLTGHRMDFGTLQLSAGFVGRHSFDFAHAGFCLAINTFGPFILYVLCLYTAVLYVCMLSINSVRKATCESVHANVNAGACEGMHCSAGLQGVPSGHTGDLSSPAMAAIADQSSAATARTTAAVNSSSAPTADVRTKTRAREWARSAVHVVLVYQCATMCASCCAAALLRRHLMVWAIFAPKMAFEACIWLAVALTHQLLLVFIPL